MRTSEPADSEEFQAALDAAERGVIVSDTGLSEKVEAALAKVRAAVPNPPQSLIDAAREAFDATQ